jgi:thioredoxin-related protein
MFTGKSLVAVLVFISTIALARAEWPTDYEKALAKAKSENKRVLLDFTGSDWCGPCIQLNKTVFSTKEFRDYADKNLIFVEVDYPKGKRQSAELVKQNEKLAKQYKIEEKGYPTIVLLDPSGRIVRELNGYSGETTADMIAWIEGNSQE